MTLKERFMKLPRESQLALKQISERESTKEKQLKLLGELVDKYWEEYELIKDDEQFSDVEKHQFIASVIDTRYGNISPTVTKTLAPIGIKSVFRDINNFTGRFASLFVLDKDDNYSKIHTLLLKEGAITSFDDIPFGRCIWKEIEVSVMKKGGFIADERADLSTPLPFKGMDYIYKMNYPKVYCDTAYENLSAKITTGTSSYTDDTDWRVMRGMVQKIITWNRKDDKGLYHLFDSK